MERILLIFKSALIWFVGNIYQIRPWLVLLPQLFVLLFPHLAVAAEIGAYCWVLFHNNGFELALSAILLTSYLSNEYLDHFVLADMTNEGATTEEKAFELFGWVTRGVFLGMAILPPINNLFSLFSVPTMESLYILAIALNLKLMAWRSFYLWKQISKKKKEEQKSLRSRLKLKDRGIHKSPKQDDVKNSS